MSIVIRAVEDKDIASFHSFLLQAYEPDRLLGLNFPATRATLEDVAVHFQGNLCYIMELEGEIISSCSLRLPWGPNPGPRELPHIGWFCTNPAFARQGYGSKMLAWVEQEILVKQLKAPAVTLGTAKEHPWLFNMYERKGYRHFKTALLGRGHTTIYMIKSLR